jgi:hypothetical protein
MLASNPSAEAGNNVEGAGAQVSAPECLASDIVLKSGKRSAAYSGR